MAGEGIDREGHRSTERWLQDFKEALIGAFNGTSRIEESVCDCSIARAYLQRSLAGHLVYASRLIVVRGDQPIIVYSEDNHTGFVNLEVETPKGTIRFNELEGELYLLGIGPQSLPSVLNFVLGLPLVMRPLVKVVGRRVYLRTRYAPC